jgi:hypothetical protein
VSRVEANEPALREKWRFGDEEKQIPSYQAEFEKVFNDIYGRSDVELGDYFDEMQIQHIPHYAYGEEIAVLIEKISDKFSLKRSYKSFANRLVHSKVPWGDVDADYEESQSYTPSLQDRAAMLFHQLQKNRRVLIAAGFSILAVVAAVALSMLAQSQRDFRDTRQKNEDLINERDKATAELQYNKLSLQDLDKKLQEAQLPASLIAELREQIKSLTGQLADSDRQLKGAQQEAVNQRNLRKQKEAQIDTLQKQVDSSQQGLKSCQSEYNKLRAQCVQRSNKG